MKPQIWTLLTLFTLTLSSPLSTTPLSPRLPLPESSLSSSTITKSTIPPSQLLPKRQTPLNTFINILLSYIPAINGPIEAVSGVLTAFENLLAILTGQQTTYNEINGGACKPYTVLFARGTTEPGNVGILVGPPFFEALKDRVGRANLAIQGVNNYDADVEGYLAGGDKGGSASMANQITTTKTKCPNTKLIISGYSQGGQVTHNAAALLSAETAAWVSKVVIFGDPLSLKPVPKIASSKVKIYCHAGDAICLNGALILPPHLTYAIDAWGAAVFATS